MALFGKNHNKKSVPNHKTTIITEGAHFKGELNLICELFIDGTLQGVIVSNHEITVGNNGHVLGDMQATRIVIHGHVEGNIDADEVYIQSEGYLLGTVIANKLVVDPTAVFDGESHIKHSEVRP